MSQFRLFIIILFFTFFLASCFFSKNEYKDIVSNSGVTQDVVISESVNASIAQSGAVETMSFS